MPLLLLLFLLPSVAFASALEIEVTPREEGELVRVMLSATTTSVNAVEGTLLLPIGARVRELMTGESVIGNWLEAPQLKGNAIRFAGIIPGGFTGMASVEGGFVAPGALFSFLLEGGGAVLLTGGAVYIHDGNGTRIALAEGPLPVREGTYALTEDRTPPERIDVEPVEDALVADGRYALLLTAYDNESGIDYIEVEEQGARVRVESVYVVRDPYGLSDIRVRAYDRAGNFLETHVEGRNRSLVWIACALFALLLIAGVYFLRKRS